MPWGWFTVIVLAVLVAQTAVVAPLGFNGVDLLLTAALVCGLVAPAPDARLGGWVIGFARDLQSSDPMGLGAFVFGLAIMALTYLRDMVIRHRWWARWVIGLVVALPAQIILNTYAYAANGAVFQIVGAALINATVASLLAALLVGLPSLSSAAGRRRQTLARW